MIISKSISMNIFEIQTHPKIRYLAINNETSFIYIYINIYIPIFKDALCKLVDMNILEFNIFAMCVECGYKFRQSYVIIHSFMGILMLRYIQFDISAEYT